MHGRGAPPEGLRPREGLIPTRGSDWARRRRLCRCKQPQAWGWENLGRPSPSDFGRPSLQARQLLGRERSLGLGALGYCPFGRAMPTGTQAGLVGRAWHTNPQDGGVGNTRNAPSASLGCGSSWPARSRPWRSCCLPASHPHSLSRIGLMGTRSSRGTGRFVARISRSELPSPSESCKGCHPRESVGLRG